MAEVLKFRPTETDRKRYGLDALVEFEPARFTNREADALQTQVPDPDEPTKMLSPKRWMELLRGEIAEDEHGMPLIDEETGEPRKTWSPATISRLYWLAIRRTGAVVEWDDFEYDMWGTSFEPQEEEPGKEEPDPSPTLPLSEPA